MDQNWYLWMSRVQGPTWLRDQANAPANPSFFAYEALSLIEPVSSNVTTVVRAVSYKNCQNRAVNIEDGRHGGDCDAHRRVATIVPSCSNSLSDHTRQVKAQ